ncbi:ABC transporter permease [Azoarcus indigens]|uniref:Transport permease protein n=1 Tax=Azoarcus indigens TaxID=29545 RepID=A0A4R6DTX0_9RHOO|nr:ABC transporter permease [Azoarcus indigens]TDN48625.1 lipopolysaccharide transport system permease protein [Azoarcus indigens]
MIAAEPSRHATQVIAPGLADKHYWRDIWRYRGLFIVLAWRDLSVRYKQTIVGLAWALLQPLLTMIVFTIVFSKLAKLPTDGTTPYALMVYAGMLPWLLISSSLVGTANSVINNANLVSKVYFPRLIVPVSSLVVSIVDFMVGFIVLVALMLWYGVVPNWHVVALPLFLIMAILVSIGPGLWAASLNVKYRDFRYIIPFFVQFGLYASPIGFSSSIVPEKWRLLYSLNPAVSVIDGFRWALLGSPSPYLPGLWISCGVILLFLWVGLYQFRKMEKNFADLI